MINIRVCLTLSFYLFVNYCFIYYFNAVCVLPYINISSKTERNSEEILFLLIAVDAEVIVGY